VNSKFTGKNPFDQKFSASIIVLFGVWPLDNFYVYCPSIGPIQDIPLFYIANLSGFLHFFIVLHHWSFFEKLFRNNPFKCDFTASQLFLQLIVPL
jgi:hypothetical protein